MVHLDRRSQLFASSLSAVAGYVDALGFMKLGGFFVSFMSGNSTRLAVGLVNGTPSAPVAAGLIGTFVAGVMLGTAVGHSRGPGRPRAVLILMTCLLAASSLFDLGGAGRLATVAMTLAMGAENTIFAEEGDVRFGLTYMTGTLVKMAQRLALTLLRRERVEWVPYLFLWIGLLSGAVVGAQAYAHLGLQGLWLATGCTALLAVLVPTRLESR